MSTPSSHNLSKLFNPYFFAVTLFISFNYFVFVFEYVALRNPSLSIVMLIAFHIVFIMLLWSMFRSIFSDAGKVPIYWGFFAEESDNRKRRYCLLCHSFKPERYFITHKLDAIIAQPASDVYSTWIIIVLGFQTVLDFQIANTSCFSCFTSFWLWSFLSAAKFLWSQRKEFKLLTEIKSLLYIQESELRGWLPRLLSFSLFRCFSSSMLNLSLKTAQRWTICKSKEILMLGRTFITLGHMKICCRCLDCQNHCGFYQLLIRNKKPMG